MKTIKTLQQFQSVLRAERVIIFVGFEWSSQSILSKNIVIEWERTWFIWNENIQVEIYELDGDAIDGTSDWITKIGEIGGYGSLNWVEDGKLRERVDYVVGAGLQKISRITNELWEI